MRSSRVGLVGVVAVLAAGCGTSPSASGPGEHGASAQLVSFESCSQMLDVVRSEALGQVGPYGLSGGAYGADVRSPAGLVSGGMAGAVAAPAATDFSAGSGSAGSASGSSPSFSMTNNQEQGVDEPDTAKTDGSIMVVLRQDQNGLEVVSVGSAPALDAFLPLSTVVNPSGLFLIGSDAVVLGSAPRSNSLPNPSSNTPSSSAPSSVPNSVPTTVAAVVNLSDPHHPTVADTFSVPGSEIDARLINGTVELVVQSSPVLPFVVPSGGSPTSTSDALATNRAAVSNAPASAWLPTVTSEPSGQTTSASCAATMHDTSDTGLGTVSVIPIDPSSATPGPPATVMGSASAVYASATALYVASTTYPSYPPTPQAVGVPVPVPLTNDASQPALPDGTAQPVSPDQSGNTNISEFDLSNPRAPAYVGSGQVPGTLIGQYAMSEYDGYLRVATTVGTATPAPLDGSAPATQSDNRVTVLQPSGGALVTVGMLQGLGAGEKIYAVRFMGPLAYVVTFRQTDPLYVVDLTNPRSPTMAGQLPLTGYSAFLEPVGTGLLLGVGQAVDQNLRTDGLQISLFDVSNPSQPVLVAKDVLPDASSSAENDPHALLYWASDALVVLPVSGNGAMPSTSWSSFQGAVAYHVSSNALTKAGQIVPPAPPAGTGSDGTGTTGGGSAVGGVEGISAPGIAAAPGGGAVVSTPAMAPGYYVGGGVERTLVVGTTLYSVTGSGILVSDLGSFSQLAWMAYS